MARTGTGDRVAAWGLVAVLAGAGVTHFTRPAFYDPLVPEWLPGTARQWTLGSGAVELAVAAMVAVPRTRATGARAAGWLFVGVFPGNVKMAADWRDRSGREQAAAYGRLPLQVPLVLWARRVRRTARTAHA